MKLFTALFTAVVAFTGVAADAHAQPGPPPMMDDDLDLGLGLDADVDVDVDVARAPVGPEAARPRRANPRARLRAALRRRFDRDHDGRLDRRERRAAIRFLRQRARQIRRDPERRAR